MTGLGAFLADIGFGMDTKMNVVVHKYKYRDEVELNDQSPDSAEKGGVLDKKQRESRAFMSKTQLKRATLLKWGE